MMDGGEAANILGRTLGVHAATTSVRVPFVRPEAPSPAMARPIMSMVDEEAAPQMAEPTSNTARKARYVHFARELSDEKTFFFFF